MRCARPGKLRRPFCRISAGMPIASAQADAHAWPGAPASAGGDHQDHLGVGGGRGPKLPPPIDCVPAIVKQVGNRATVLFDSGVRSGADVVKADLDGLTIAGRVAGTLGAAAPFARVFAFGSLAVGMQWLFSALGRHHLVVASPPAFASCVPFILIPMIARLHASALPKIQRRWLAAATGAVCAALAFWVCPGSWPARPADAAQSRCTAGAGGPSRPRLPTRRGRGARSRTTGERATTGSPHRRAASRCAPAPRSPARGSRPGRGLRASR